MQKGRDDKTEQGVREVCITDVEGYRYTREMYLQKGFDKIWSAIYKQVRQMALKQKIVIQLAHHDIQKNFIWAIIHSSNLSSDDRERLEDECDVLFKYINKLSTPFVCRNLKMFGASPIIFRPFRII